MVAFYTRTNLLNFNIALTRFTNETYLQNKFWRERHSHYGCIYGCPVKISYVIDPDIILFVLEMNNTTNKIMGISVIQPMSCVGYKYKVNAKDNDKDNDIVSTKYTKKVNIYDDKNYNRFISGILLASEKHRKGQNFKRKRHNFDRFLDSRNQNT